MSTELSKYFKSSESPNHHLVSVESVPSQTSMSRPRCFSGTCQPFTCKESGALMSLPRKNKVFGDRDNRDGSKVDRNVIRNCNTIHIIYIMYIVWWRTLKITYNTRKSVYNKSWNHQCEIKIWLIRQPALPLLVHHSYPQPHLGKGHQVPCRRGVCAGG